MNVSKAVMIFIVCFIVLSCSAFAGRAYGEVPEDLNIIWARSNSDPTPLFAEPYLTSDVKENIVSGEIMYIIGETESVGQKWYQVSTYGAGVVADAWVRSEDAWFSSIHDPGMSPRSYLLFDRLRMKFARFVGTYPERSRQLLGRERDARFTKGDGYSIQTLMWRGLKIVYENSYNRPDGAWISYIDVTDGAAGRKISFGPIHLGSSIDDVRVLGDHLGFEYEYLDRSKKNGERLDEFMLDDGTTVIQLTTESYGRPAEIGCPYSFTFFIKNGVVVRMEHRWAYNDM